MSDRHQETLAAYRDVSSVYSYGYGALRECAQQLEAGTRTLEAFTDAWHRIVAAVEFRAAELQAEVLQENLNISLRVSREVPTAPPMPLTGIYVSDENADERRNEQ